MRDMIRDAAYALRVLQRQPGFALVALATIALGIGANTVIFSVVNSVLLQPLPYPDADQLHLVWKSERNTGERLNPAYPEIQEWTRAVEGDVRIAGFGFETYDLTGATEPEQIRAASVDVNFFEVMGVPPSAGRPFVASDRSDADNLLVLNHALWTRQFGQDPDLLNRTIQLNGQPFTVVGIMPQNFNYPEFADAWVLALGPTSTTVANQVIARIPQPDNPAPFVAQLSSIAVAAAEAQGSDEQVAGVEIESLHESTVGGTRTALLILLGAVGLTLLAACANVAHMLLARAAAREREMAVRIAIGASRWRIVRQLLSESVVLGVLGGAAGALLASWVFPVLVSLIPDTIPRRDTVVLDGTVFSFALLLAVSTGIIFGIAPALRASRTDIQAGLKTGVTPGSRSRFSGRGMLVVSEVAAATVLMIGAGLFLRSFQALRNTDLGFDAAPVFTWGMVLPNNAYENSAAVVQFHRELRSALVANPDIESAAGVNFVPLGGPGIPATVTVAGETEPADGAAWRVATPGVFNTLGIPILRGRDFTEADGPDGQPVVIINETFAQRFFGTADPVGQTMTLGMFGPPVQVSVVGIVGDIRQSGITQAPNADAYIPFAQNPWRYMNLLVKSRSGAVEELGPVVRSVIGEIDPARPIFGAVPLTVFLDGQMADTRFSAFLMSAFGVLTFVLAAVGIYGTMAYTVSRQTKELGLRIALGGEASAVVRMVLFQGLRLIAAGVVVGLVATFGLSRTVSGLLFGITGSDPITYVGVTVLLGMVGAAACYIPARRATRIDPLIALRAD